MLELHGGTVPLYDIADLIHAEAPALPSRSPAIVVSAAGRRTALLCDRLIGEEEVVVKPLGPLLAGINGFLGGAILGDGRIALLLDPAALIRARPRNSPRRDDASAPVKRLAPKVLVAEDSFTVRELQRSILEAAGYRVETARDGSDAFTRLLGDDEIALLLTDIVMPEMDGLALTRAIRDDPAKSSTPVVILTSRADEAIGDAARGRRGRVHDQGQLDQHRCSRRSNGSSADDTCSLFGFSSARTRAPTRPPQRMLERTNDRGDCRPSRRRVGDCGLPVQRPNLVTMDIDLRGMTGSRRRADHERPAAADPVISGSTRAGAWHRALAAGRSK